jgi:hypothetical protein
MAAVSEPSSFVVPARRRGTDLSATLTRSVGEECVLEVRLSDGVAVTARADDLFEALVQARRQLEEVGVSLACQGSRIGVYPSPMQRQGGRGTTAYVLGDKRIRPETVRIFEPASWSDIGTVDDQRAAYEVWLGPEFRPRSDEP